jgi:hypothetical protein
MTLGVVLILFLGISYGGKKFHGILTVAAFVKRVNNFQFFDLDLTRNHVPTGADPLRFIDSQNKIDLETGETTNLTYNIRVVEHLISLDFVPGIEAISCQKDSLEIIWDSNGWNTRMYLTYLTVVVWDLGSLLVGGAEWLCLGEYGNPAAFYRQIIGFEIKENSVNYLTVNKSFVDCFRESNIRLFHNPGKIEKQKRISVDHTFTLKSWSLKNSTPIIQSGITFQSINFSDSKAYSLVGNSDFTIATGIEFALTTHGFFHMTIDLFKIRAFASATYNLGVFVPFQSLFGRFDSYRWLQLDVHEANTLVCLYFTSYCVLYWNCSNLNHT